MKFFEACDYQENCNKLFKKYQAMILNILPDARVEHVGSSAVAGAISKGDLDIFVGVDRVKLEDSVDLLKTLDFREKLNTQRTTELCMLESLSEDVAFQVIANGSKFEFFLEFRDKLRKSSELLDSYNELKLDCSDMDENEYRKRKSEFIESVLCSV